MRLEAFQRLDPNSPAPIAVAVSGGGDSLFALIRACEWAKSVRRPVLALSVDHGLQAESAAWTAFAGEQAQRLGATFSALKWAGPKPVSGLPAAARDARHALLADAARAAGCTVIVTGHTADDQAENLAMSLSPLREWSPSPAWPQGRGLFLLRPLLGLRRAALRKSLSADGWRWIDDPANEDARHLRVRVRQALADREPSQPSPGSIAKGPTPIGKGLDATLRLKRGDITARSVAVAAVCAGGGSRLPRLDSIERIVDRARGNETFAATLCGARIDVGEDVLFTREQGRRGLTTLPLTPGEALVWDGRFEIEASVPGLSVRRLAEAAATLSLEEKAALRRIDAKARPALPLIQRRDETVFCPLFSRQNGVRAEAIVTPRFLAACDAFQTEQQACDVVSMANEAEASYLGALG